MASIPQYCPHCGTRMVPTARFCVHCGQVLRPAPPPFTSPGVPPFGREGTEESPPELAFKPPPEAENISYLVSQLDHLRARGWMTADAARAAQGEYEERRGELLREAEIEARLREAQRLERSTPARAAAHYEQVLRLDPTRVPAYHRLAALYQDLQRPEDLFRICAVGSRYDPELGRQAEALRARQERQAQLQARGDALQRARTRGDPGALEAAAQALLELEPNHFEGLLTLLRVYEDQGRWEPALAVCDRLMAAYPRHVQRPAWETTRRRLARQLRPAQETPGEEREEILELRQQARRRRPPQEDVPPPVSPPHRAETGVQDREPALPPPLPARRPSREAPSPVARRRTEPNWFVNFLHTHTQEALIYLGVIILLIAGTIYATTQWGALPNWAKYLGMLVYTGFFFGLGLVLILRLEQRSAGEKILLLVAGLVPINGIIMGELRLFQGFDLLNWIVGLAGIAALVYVSIIVIGHRERQGIRLFLPLFLAFSALQALPGSATPEWGWALLYSSVVLLLLGIACVNRRLEAPTQMGRREFLLFGLGLMAYAEAMLLLRVGVWSAHFPVVGYAPLFVLLAIAVFDTTAHLPKLLDEPQLPSLVGWGYGLMALGWAIALAHYREAAVLFAIGVLSLLIWGTLVVVHRRPSDLYLAFAAFGVAWGAWPFLWQEFAAKVHLLASNLLGYGEEPLPFAFRSLGLVGVSAGLLALAHVFDRRWKEPRLVAPCHLAGLPLAVVALGIAAWVPRAACYTSLGYALLAAYAACRWRQPRLVYAAAGAASGSLYAFAVWQGWALPMQGVALAILGLVWLTLASGFAPRWAAEYRQPLVVVALVLSLFPLGVGVVALANGLAQGQPWPGVGVLPLPPERVPEELVSLALLLTAGLYAWAGPLLRQPGWTYPAVAVASLALYAGIAAVGWSAKAQAAGLATLTLFWQALSVALRSRSQEDYANPVQHVVLAFSLAPLTLGLYTWNTAFGCLSLGIVSALYLWAAWLTTTAALSYLGLGTLALATGGVWALAGLPPGQAGCGVAALALAWIYYGGGELLYRRQPQAVGAMAAALPTTRLYAWPLLHTSLAGGAVGLALAARETPWGGHTVAALALASALAATATRVFATPLLTYIAAAAGGWAMAVVGEVFLSRWVAVPNLTWASQSHAVLFAVSTLVLYGIGAAGRRVKQETADWPRWDRVYRHPLLHSALALSAVTLGLAFWQGARNGPASVPYNCVAFGLTALLYGLLTRIYAAPVLTHGAVWCLVAAVATAVWKVEPPLLLKSFWLSLAGLGLAAGAWTLAFVGQRGHLGRERRGVRSLPGEGVAWTRLYADPLYLNAWGLVLVALGLGGANPLIAALAALLALAPLWSHPSANWLYAVLGLGLLAAYDGLWPQLPEALRPLALVTTGLGLWLVGLLLDLRGPAIAPALRLSDQAYAPPVYHGALGLAVGGAVAVGFTLASAGTGIASGTTLGAVFLLGLFAVLMIQAYPHPAWLYAAGGGWGYGLWAAFRPLLTTTFSFLPDEGGITDALLLLVLAFLWLGVGHLLARRGTRWATQLQLPSQACQEPLYHLSWLLGGGVAVGLVALSTGALAATWEAVPPPQTFLPGLSWGLVLILFALTETYLLLVFRAWPGVELLWAKKGFELGFWWWLLGRPEGWITLPYPTATAVLALLLAILGAVPHVAGDLYRLLAGPRGQRESPSVQDRLPLPSALAEGEFMAVLRQAALGSTVLALLLTGGPVTPATCVTLFLAAAVFGLTAATQHRPGFLYASASALQLGLFYVLVGLARTTQGSGGGAGNPWEIASFFAIVAAVPMGLFTLLAERLARWGDAEGRPIGLAYARPLRHVAFTLTGIVAAAVIASWVMLPYPPGTGHVVLVSVSLGLLAVYFFNRALREGTEWPIYCGELAFASAYFYLRFAVGLPRNLDPWALVLGSIVLTGLSRSLQERTVFRRPMLVTGLLLPAVPLLLLAVRGQLPQEGIGVTFTIAVFYGVIWRLTDWKWAGAVFSTLTQAAFCLWWLSQELTFRDHLQYYVLPAGMLTLVWARVHRRDLGADQARQIAAVATAAMYLAATWDLFTHPTALGYWIALTVLATAGLLFGYIARVRLFFLMGGFFLLGNCLALLTQQTLAHPQWVFFILFGVGLTILAVGIFWRRIGEAWRDLQEWWEE